MTTNFSHQIYKFRVLWALGWLSFAFTWWYAFVYDAWSLLLGSYIWARIVTFFGVQITLHRYFSHRAFTTTKFKHRLLLWFSVLSGEGSPISWAIHHRHHHKYSDKELDLHSPVESRLKSALFWQISPVSWWLHTKQVRTIPRDLLRDNQVKFVDQYYYHIWLILILGTLLIDWKITIFFLLAPVGWALVNAISNFVLHWPLIGNYRNFDTDDNSYNNQWIAYYLGGEGLHNNHHQYPNRYDQAVNSNEFDLAGWVVKKWFVTTI